MTLFDAVIVPDAVKLPFNVVVPDTFNDDLHVVVLFNIVVPDTYNDVFIDSVETYDSFDKAILIENLNLLKNDSAVSPVKDKIIFYYR